MKYVKIINNLSESYSLMQHMIIDMSQLEYHIKFHSRNINIFPYIRQLNLLNELFTDLS